MEDNKILNLILDKLTSLDEVQKEMKDDLKKLTHKVDIIDTKIDRLEINQKEIIKELGYGFSKVGENQLHIKEVKEDVKEVKKTLEHHNLKV